MKASVVIPAYNAAATLPLVLEALTRQDTSDFDVVVVDDASTDGTGRTAKAHGGGLDLLVLRCPENLGRAKARHFGIDNSQGEVLLLLDADIEPIPEYLATHLSLHAEHPRSVGVGRMRFPSELAGKALARYTMTRGAAKVAAGAALPGKYFISCLASFPRALYEESGGFDLSFRSWGGEDLELGLRFQKIGAHLVNLPGAVGYHHHLRPLPEMLQVLENYGRESIPRILELHPEFAAELYVDDLIASSNATTFTVGLRNLAASELIYHSLARLAGAFSSQWLPAPLLTYLFWAAYRMGYKSSGTGNI
jgi:glycosyltransferase involved in cell wall biosynthesis